MLDVMTIVGTRPEVIRLSLVIEKLDRFANHTLVHTGQNFDYELNEVFFRDLEIRRPDHFLGAAGATPAETIANVIVGVDRLLEQRRPHAILILGDTNSCLAAISAKRRQIPVFHMEAGNRCFDNRVPEEINRRIIDHTADIHLTYSQIARSYLIREGIAPDQIICTGSPMREVLQRHAARIDTSDVVERLGLQPGEYFVLSCHRQENVDDECRLRQVFEVIQAVSAEYGLPVVVSTHPRTRARIEFFGMAAPANAIFMKPFGFTDYVRLQGDARAVLSDSGTITEESSIMNFPALNLRDVHERPEGMEEGAVMMVGLDPERVLTGLRVLADQGRGEHRTMQMVADYASANVSEKVLRIILSYTDFVNRRVWHAVE
ncbi:MAG: non-hydrolyzing UDP-N-acetylglucosamine 2-epimerase [Longimicrobiales bacterium]